MSYLVLARKWRPKKFSELVGQVHAVKTLSNAINNNKVHHAWLLTGTRGVGKTTLARAFAKSLNCLNGVGADPCGECTACLSINKGSFVDLIEVDAASRTGVEDTRALLEGLSYSPTMGRFRIFLIDEVHMFSNSSFNALLKSLEEPPPHVKFLLATTEPQKIPITVLSRCIQIRLLRLEADEINDHLQHILDQETIPYDQEATRLIALSADGSMRDALSLLDQIIAVGDNQVSTEVVRGVLGVSDENAIPKLITALAKFDGTTVLEAARELLKSTTQLSSLFQLLQEYFHQMALYRQLGQASLNLGRVRDVEFIKQNSHLFEIEELHLMFHMIQKGQTDVIRSFNPASSFEMLMLRLLAFRPQRPTSEHADIPSSSLSDNSAADELAQETHALNAKKNAEKKNKTQQSTHINSTINSAINST